MTDQQRERWLAAGIVLGGFLLRTFRLGYQELRGDSAFSYIVANRPLPDILTFLIRGGEPHPPLHFFLMNWSLNYTGLSEYSIRTIGVLATLLMLPALYIIGRRLINGRFGLAVMALAAINPLLIWAAQDGRHQYALVIGWATVATAVFMQAVAARSAGQRWLWWSGYALTAGLTMYSHYYGIFALLAHGVFLLWTLVAQRGWTNWRRWNSDVARLGYWALSGMAAAAVFLPWLFLAAPAMFAKANEPSNPRLAEHLTAVGVELLLATTFGYDWDRWLFLLAAGLAIVGAIYLFRRQPAWAGALTFWLLSSALALYLVRFERALFNSFYIIAASTPFLILLAAGVWDLAQRPTRWQRGIAIGGTFVLIGGMMVSLYHYYFDPAFSKNWGYREVAAHLAQEVDENSSEVLVAHYPDPNFAYYFRDIPAAQTMVPGEPGHPPGRVRKDLADLSADYDRLWFVPAHRSSWDPEDIAYEWLEFETLREQSNQFDRLELLAYRPPTTLPTVMTPVERTIPDELRLESVFVTVNGRPVDPTQPLTLKPEDQLRVTLGWEALGTIPQSYTAFVHLLGDGGQMIAQHDGIPVDGQRPTIFWQEGETFLDTHELLIPAAAAPSAGTLFIGLYTTEGVERLLFDDGLDTWPLTSVSVSPPLNVPEE